MLTDEQVELIRASATAVAGANIKATDVFYTNLFKAAPGVRPLFPESMFEQSEKLWQTIAKVVASADDLSAIQNELREMGARHVTYGAEPAHYAVVSEVLIQTLAILTPEDWTDDTQAAWQAALDAICSTMLEGKAQRVG